MAGARAVEEILSRGGADLFKITMFGDEPYGNYNRIMLSHVLSGEEAATATSSSTRWRGTKRTASPCTPARVNRIDRYAKVVFSDDGEATSYDMLIIATGSRSFMPPMDGMYDRERRLAARRLRLPHHRRHAGMIAYATHDDHHKAVVIGGGLLGLEAARGLQSHGIEVTSSTRAAGT